MASSTPGALQRRFSSPSRSKLPLPKRDPSPSAKPKSTSRPSSPIPSKCAVPSLVAAKEENRRTSKEPAIVVPSRYRQPSPPVGGRRGSVSPGARRLSIGGEGSVGGRRKVGVFRVSDALLGSSGRSARKSWEENFGEAKKNKGDQQALRAKVAISRRLSDAAKEQPNCEEEEAPRNNEKLNHLTEKITVHDRKWTDGSIPFDAVSENLAKLGKEALQRRNMVSVAAAEALEEALATESVIRCLNMFSDLRSSSKARNPLPTIDRFLSIYEDAIKWISISESLVASRNGHNETILMDITKSATLWVDAALATDLEVVSLVDNLENHSKQKISGQPLLPLIDIPRANFSKKNSLATPVKSQAKMSAMANVSFAKSLLREMQSWFMKFVEDSLDVGFRLFGEASDDSCKDNGRVAAVLSQLKRVNEWLDAVGKNPDVMIVVEKIERLKRKIYGFVITHVGSAFDSSVSLSKVA